MGSVAINIDQKRGNIQICFKKTMRAFRYQKDRRGLSKQKIIRSNGNTIYHPAKRINKLVQNLRAELPQWGRGVGGGIARFLRKNPDRTTQVSFCKILFMFFSSEKKRGLWPIIAEVVSFFVFLKNKKA